MKISKSKKELARLIVDAGVKRFPKRAGWAAQDADDGLIFFYKSKPVRESGNDFWSDGVEIIDQISTTDDVVIQGWHQTALSRAEFDLIVAESAEQSKPDADGWIEWKGGKCPAPTGVSVDVKYRDGREELNLPANQYEPHRNPDASYKFWINENHKNDIIAYRLHKPEQVEPQCCESVTPENFAENIDVERARNYMASRESERAATPTLDQLLQDYRNASDFAAAKQAEADEAAKMRDERWQAVQARACELGVHISVELVVDAEMHEPEMVITDWRDLRLGDEIEVVESDQSHCNGLVGVVSRFDEADHQKPFRVIFDGNDRKYDWPIKWRFIRRP